MSTVIDSLIVLLKLDSSNFTDEQKKALESSNKFLDTMDSKVKTLESRNKAAAHSFGDMTNAAEGLFTVIAGAGMAAFARDTMNSVAATGRMATNIGIATGELSAFGRMVERNGGSAETAAGSMKSFTDTMQRAKWGEVSTSFLMGLSQVGGGMEDNALSAFFKLAKFAETNTVQDTNLAGQRLGFSQDQINVALKGLAQAMKEFKAASDGAISPAQAAKLTEMQGAWNTLGQAVKTIGTDVEANVAPAFVTAANAISAWTLKNRGFADSLAEILAAIAGLSALKPAAWLLRLLGLGVLIGPLAPAAALTALVMAIKPQPAGEGEENIYDSSGKMTNYGRRITGSDTDYTAAIAAIESRGKGYAGVGPRTRTGDRAYGKYQVMGDNIPSWTKEALGTSMTPEQFMASPAAQEEVFRKKFGEYAAKYGAFGAAAAWFAGEGGMKDMGRRDAVGTSVSDYVRKFNDNLSAGSGRAPQAAGGSGDVTIENLTINTDTKDPKQHGRLAADAIRDGLAAKIANNANTGQRQ